jgi:polyisoprenyl-teichoic acid--peptidoglycan teichoic acid transferase
MPDPVDYPAYARRRHDRRSPPAHRRVARRTDRPYRTRQTPPAALVSAAGAVEPGFPAPATPVALGRRGVRPERVESSPGRDDAAATTPAYLQEEFERLREQQQAGGRRRRRPRSRRALIVLAVPLVLLIAAAAVVGPVIYRGTRAYQEVFVEPPPRQDPPIIAMRNPEGTAVIATATATTTAVEIPEWNGTDRLTMLLMGVDRRQDEPSRSDTMILVNIDPVTKTARMLAIPRDLTVIIPGYGVHKVNAAYAFGDADKLPGGGAGLVVRTIETNFGIRIDYYAEVDFNGFVKLVDTLGGVTLDVPYPIKDDAYPASGTNYMRVYFSAGWQHMDGARALEYARTRHDDGDGNRSVRQEQVLLALRQQAVNLDLLPKAGELLAEIGDAVRTDLPPTKALQLARLATEFSPASITSYSLDPALTEDDSPDGYYLDADWDAVGQILSEFTGTTVTPPMSALAHPRLDIPIRVENGSTNDGLGGRVAQVLRDKGFTNVTVVERPPAGTVPASSITANPSDLPTAFLVAGLTGVDLDAVTLRGQAAPTPAPTAAATGRAGTPAASPAARTPQATKGNPDVDGIVIRLGADARDPAYFSPEPFNDEPAPADNSAANGGTGDETDQG